MAEEIPAMPESPQVACLDKVRSSDVVILILGSEDGEPLLSGSSPTYEEYCEAREMSLPVLAFIETGASQNAARGSFVVRVREWASGLYTASFSDPEDLKAKVTNSLHQHVLGEAESPVDEEALATRARELLPERSSLGAPVFALAIASGPRQEVLRPAQLGDQELWKFLQREALTGNDAVLRLTSATKTITMRDAITLRQQERDVSVTISQEGDILAVQPGIESDRTVLGIPGIIEEDLQELVVRILQFGRRVLDYVDSTHRIRRVAVAAAVLDAGYFPWRTRKEQAQDPNRAFVGLRRNSDRVVVGLSQATQLRTALARDAAKTAQDLVALLRRELAPTTH